MIRVFKSDCQDEKFYAKMGRFFASLDIAKELERQVYNKDNSVWYISTYRDSILGFVAVFDNGTHYFVDNLYVMPHSRGQGVAKELVGEIVEDFTDKQIRCVAVDPAALKIFDCFGFEKVGMNGKYTKLCKH